jgi:hypothetical protein
MVALAVRGWLRGAQKYSYGFLNPGRTGAQFFPGCGFFDPCRLGSGSAGFQEGLFYSTVTSCFLASSRPFW